MVSALRQLIQKIPLSSIFILGTIAIAAMLRVHLYGDPRLSISGNDTASYVDASRAPLFSSEIMTGRRLLSTNLVYKALEPKDGYQITINGSISTVRRGYQPGFDGIVLLQLALSIIGWGMLAYMVAAHLKNPFMKFLSAALILLFAFTPQIADWDSILMSESLTFSIFALLLALLVKITFALHRNPEDNVTGWVIAWGVLFFFWVFLRDTNLFTALVTIGMMGGVLVFKKYRKNKYLLGSVAFITAIFLLGLVTSSQSVRSHVQLVNIYNDDLLPHQSRVSTLMGYGMPTPGSPEYKEWFKDHASTTLVKFIATHPGYVAEKLLRDFPMAFDEIKQTYFKAPELNPSREQLMHLGDALHPENTTPFLITSLLLIGILYIARKDQDTRPWAWLGLWLFLAASVTMIPTILGDTWAINRHALFSTMIYRLGVWLFAVIVMDLAIENTAQKPNLTSNHQP